MLKIIVDFLSNQGDIILRYPVPFLIVFVVGLALGWGVNSWVQKNKIETNEERLKYKEDQLKDRDIKIQSLEQKMASLSKDEQVDKTIPLSKDEIQALKAIKEFEDNNPIQSTSSPPEYSVDHLMKDLGVSWEESNEILRKFRRFGLFESIWDNLQSFPNRERPINETRPGRLSKDGKDLVRKYRNRDQSN